MALRLQKRLHALLEAWHTGLSFGAVGGDGVVEVGSILPVISCGRARGGTWFLEWGSAQSIAAGPRSKCLIFCSKNGLHTSAWHSSKHLSGHGTPTLHGVESRLVATPPFGCGRAKGPKYALCSRCRTRRKRRAHLSQSLGTCQGKLGNGGFFVSASDLTGRAVEVPLCRPLGRRRRAHGARDGRALPRARCAGCWRQCPWVA